MAKKNSPVYIKVLQSMLMLRATGYFYGRWIKADVIVKLLQNPSHVITNFDVASFTEAKLKNSLSRSTAMCIDVLCTPNEFGMYRKIHYLNGRGVCLYYFTLSKSGIPPVLFNWSNVITSPTFFKQQQQQQDKTLTDTDAVTIIQNNNKHVEPVKVNQTTNKHLNTTPDTKRQKVNESNGYVSHYPKLSDKIANESKWYSPEALSLFVKGPKVTRQKRQVKQYNNIDVKRHVMSQVKTLRNAYLTYDGWREVITDGDSDDTCTPFDIFVIRMKSRYLSTALTCALGCYHCTDSFLDICSAAIDKINELDYDGCSLEEYRDSKYTRISNPRTVMQWLRLFRDNNGSFPNPSEHHCNLKRKLPTLLLDNPDLHASLLQYANSNLSSLSGEMLHDYLFTTALPAIAKKIQTKRGTPYTVKELLLDNNLKSLTHRTVYNWLQLLGYTYSPSKKSYYVDAHEKPDNIKYRKAFISRYESYELKAHRWIQISATRFDTMVTKGELEKNSGYKYNENDGSKWVELHVDMHPSFQDECNHLPYGGQLSKRKPANEKPLMIIGQDECIFKQYTLTKKSWVSPSGTRALLPKDDGQGIMVSAFVARELGYGINLTPSQLHLVNEERAKPSKRHYEDKEAATKMNGTTTKPKLTSTPFSRLLEYGVNNAGYWSYEHMVLQLEDCVDCLKILYPTFDFVFLFDHSNGHDRMQPNGLNLRKVRKNYGGRQPKMRESKNVDRSCFGPYHTKHFNLQPNGTQSMVFNPSDSGPFYMSVEDRERKKYDIHTGRYATKHILKVKLSEMLAEMGVSNPVGSAKQMQEQCRSLNLPVTKREEIVQEGWVNKPKGSLQILYERGWIDPTIVKRYTEKGRLDEMGILIESTSINLLMQKQIDFTSELTLLQYYGSQMGVSIDRTPKCHPEIAGDGIEYVWALAKLFYRYQPISRKRSKEFFRSLVEESLSVANLTLSRVRKCSKRARDYMLAYKAFAVMEMDGDGTVPTELGTHGIDVVRAGDNTNKVVMNYSLIEKTMKTFKTHRNAKDFDAKFIKKLELDDKSVEFVKGAVGRMKMELTL
jgi:hypothetical protein